MELYTNAVRFPEHDLLEVIKKYNVVVRFSDYSLNAPQKQHIEEFKNLLIFNEIKHYPKVQDILAQNILHLLCHLIDINHDLCTFGIYSSISRIVFSFPLISSTRLVVNG